MSNLLLLLLFLAIAVKLTPASAQPAPASPVKEDDVRCLRGIEQSLKDPDGRLSSWTFTNTTPGAICKLAGVACWNRLESRALALSLSGFGLQGAVPSSLQYCRSTNTLDLSNNSLSGPIPPAFCDWLPFLVNLDLSGNRLSGPLPSELANCVFLNSLKLNGNTLSGQIPASLSRLSRLRSLHLSDNRLEGQIPPQLGAAFPNESFSGNPGLCGPPVSPRCGRGLGV
ncbi:probable inactive receptor kinase At1g27190 [Lolium perenne]|jgi:hypothetical protein|uniref:probable inactive receptor kinase At1g27190 n=1 Tax=Lolium perenne TaxID=4522 RepID=UPI0021EA717C|nr:probable inactive receptor kinase At1g27190 [Lolium perenne]